jgi:hypothetical protein
LGGGGGAGGAAEVEDLAGAAEDRGDDSGVAGQRADRRGAELVAVGQSARAEAGGELVVVEGDDQLGSLSGGVGELAVG